MKGKNAKFWAIFFYIQNLISIKKKFLNIDQVQEQLNFVMLPQDYTTKNMIYKKN